MLTYSIKDYSGSKKAHRKASRTKRLVVDFDETGNPTGPNAGAFKRSINLHVCQLLPIRFKQIGEAPVQDYKSVVNALTVGTLGFIQVNLTSSCSCKSSVA